MGLDIPNGGVSYIIQYELLNALKMLLLLLECALTGSSHYGYGLTTDEEALFYGISFSYTPAVYTLPTHVTRH